MSERRGLVLKETELARKCKIEGRDVPVWIPRSVVKSIVKFAPDANGRRVVILNVEDWWLDKNRL